MGVPAGFEPYDAFPTKAGAKEAIRVIKDSGGPCAGGRGKPLVRLVNDKEAGRLKWVIYVKCVSRR